MNGMTMVVPHCSIVLVLPPVIVVLFVRVLATRVSLSFFIFLI